VWPPVTPASSAILETVGRGFGAVIFIPDGTCEDGEAQTVGARLQVTFKDPGTGYWGHRSVLATRLRNHLRVQPLPSRDHLAHFC